MDLHLLSPEVVEHLTHLADLKRALSDQLSRASITSSAEYTWTLTALCDEPVLDYTLEDMARLLNEQLQKKGPMSDHLTRRGLPRFPTLSVDVGPSLVDSNPRYTKPHVTFTLSGTHARRLFMGANLWGEPGLAYRELFQNALDACRYRMARARHHGVEYTPFIRIHHGRDAEGQEYVECEDNGIGMDRQLLASCFATAGNRFVDTEEYRREAVADALGWELSVDYAIAESLGHLNPDEYFFTHCLRDGLTWSFSFPYVSDQTRRAELARLVGVPAPPAPLQVDLDTAKGLNPEQEAIVKMLRRELSESCLDLAPLCSVARQLEHELPQALEDVLLCARLLGAATAFSDAERDVALGFTDVQWNMATNQTSYPDKLRETPRRTAPQRASARRSHRARIPP